MKKSYADLCNELKSLREKLDRMEALELQMQEQIQQLMNRYPYIYPYPMAPSAPAYPFIKPWESPFVWITSGKNISVSEGNNAYGDDTGSAGSPDSNPA